MKMISLSVTELSSVIGKSRGLLFTKKASPVLLKTRFGIHTFGLRFPIDVLVLDKENRVVKFAKSLRPNTIFFWHPKFDTVIELPSGEIEKHNINNGDHIHINL